MQPPKDSSDWFNPTEGTAPAQPAQPAPAQPAQPAPAQPAPAQPQVVGITQPGQPQVVGTPQPVMLGAAQPGVMGVAQPTMIAGQPTAFAGQPMMVGGIPTTNATLALILSIISIVTGLSICLAIPSLLLANGALAVTNQFPGHPDASNAKAAMVISWIAIGLFALFVVGLILLIFVGSMAA